MVSYLHIDWGLTGEQTTWDGRWCIRYEHQRWSAHFWGTFSWWLLEEYSHPQSSFRPTWIWQSDGVGSGCLPGLVSCEFALSEMNWGDPGALPSDPDSFYLSLTVCLGKGKVEEEEWTEPRRRETGRKTDVIEATTERLPGRKSGTFV